MKFKYLCVAFPLALAPFAAAACQASAGATEAASNITPPVACAPALAASQAAGASLGAKLAASKKLPAAVCRCTTPEMLVSL